VLQTSAVPVVAWHLVVADRFGFLPLRAPRLVDTGALGLPVVNLVRSLIEVDAAGILLIAIRVALGILAIRVWRSSDVCAAAAVSVLPILAVGPFTWRYLGDPAGLTAFLEVLVILAVVTQHWGRAEPSRQVEAPSGHKLAR